MKWSADEMRVDGFEGARPICGYCHIQRQRIQAAEKSKVHNISAVGLHANGCSTRSNLCACSEGMIWRWMREQDTGAALETRRLFTRK